MTQEQKARAYDDVREKITIRFGSNVADEIFSEFEDSEDEKIRKELIEKVKETPACIGFNNKTAVLAYLEKLKVFTEHGDGLYYFTNDEFTYVGYKPI